jgi:hypothetical protein
MFFKKKGERCQTEYSEGTAVTRVKVQSTFFEIGSEYLEGTSEEMEVVMYD